MNKRQQVIGFMVAAILFVSPAAASAANDGWRFEITPYLWAVGIEGDVTVRGQKVDFDKSASDLFDALEIGGSLRIGAERDRFLIGAQLDYFSLSTDELDVKDRPERGRLDSDILIAEAAVGYRVDGWAEGQSFGLMVGVRHLDMDNDLEVFGVGRTSRSKSVTDAMVYVLPRIPVLTSRTDRLWFNPVLGIGAGDSDFAYELFPQFQYQITDTIAARLGYRTLGWKFEDDNDNELNIRLSGFTAGLGVRF